MHADKIPQNKEQTEKKIAAQQGAGKAAIQLQDNRPRSVAQRKEFQAPVNFVANDAPVQKKANETGLPDQLKSGIENLSGYSMDDVKVHYNSAKPAQLSAHAYAQGTDIHIAAGQEKHLPHEAWHVVQQKQGRVKPTVQMKGKVGVNDDKGLEKEADVMGAKAGSVINNASVQDVKMITGAAATPVQRKIMVNNRPYTPAGNAAGPIIAAAQDEYVRHYKSDADMRADLVSVSPTSFGLIKPRALWYDLPYLSKQFFVYGESHAGVKGGDIKHASHITKPVLAEALPGWNVNDAQGHGPVVEDQGLEENSSKLLRALIGWAPKAPGTAVIGAAPAPALPLIPEGEESVRETEQGTYRLVVKGDNGASKLWQEHGAIAPPPITYDHQREVYNAIRGLFPVVFKKEIHNGKLNEVDEKLEKAWIYIGELYNESSRFFKGGKPIADWDLFAKIVRTSMINGTIKKLKENYQHLHGTTHNAGAIFKAPGGPGLDSVDDYRNEFILSAVLKAKQSNAYAFSNMGNNHLLALKSRLAGFGIPYISKDDFYNRYSKVAVSLASGNLDGEITTFLSDVKAARVAPTETRIHALLEKLDSKGYPGDSPLREELVTLLDLAQVYGFKDIEPPKGKPSEHELMAKKLGFI